MSRKLLRITGTNFSDDDFVKGKLLVAVPIESVRLVHAGEEPAIVYFDGLKNRCVYVTDEFAKQFIEVWERL